MATASVNDIVMTLSETATFLRVSEEAVLLAITEQGLEGRQIGSDWRFLRSAVEDWLRHRSLKARLLATSGSLKDDPQMDRLLKNIYAEHERERVDSTASA
jgi:excisionase family DNA binding protein